MRSLSVTRCVPVFCAGRGVCGADLPSEVQRRRHPGSGRPAQRPGGGPRQGRPPWGSERNSWPSGARVQILVRCVMGSSCCPLSSQHDVTSVWRCVSSVHLFVSTRSKWSCLIARTCLASSPCLMVDWWTCRCWRLAGSRWLTVFVEVMVSFVSLFPLGWGGSLFPWKPLGRKWHREWNRKRTQGLISHEHTQTQTHTHWVFHWCTLSFTRWITHPTCSKVLHIPFYISPNFTLCIRKMC